MQLELKTEDGQEATQRRIGTTGVVITNYRPGVMSRFGLDYESCREVKSDLIYAAVSDYRDQVELLIPNTSEFLWPYGSENQRELSLAVGRGHHGSHDDGTGHRFANIAGLSTTEIRIHQVIK